jgi:predicted transcriptional regulator
MCESCGTKCTKCHFKGVCNDYKELNNKEENVNMKELNITMKELMLKVFEIMVKRVTAKGGAKKMTSTFDIHDDLKAQGYDVNRRMIEAVLDKFIEQRYVRYYKNEKDYIYYGITQLGWERYNASKQPHQESISDLIDDSVQAVTQADVSKTA